MHTDLCSALDNTRVDPLFAANVTLVNVYDHFLICSNLRIYIVFYNRMLFRWRTKWDALTVYSSSTTPCPAISQNPDWWQGSAPFLSRPHS